MKKTSSGFIEKTIFRLTDKLPDDSDGIINFLGFSFLVVLTAIILYALSTI